MRPLDSRTKLPIYYTIMKKLCLIVTALALLPCLQAQDNPTISTSQNSTLSTEKPSAPVRTQPQKRTGPTVNTKGWQTTGLIYEMSEKGLVVISPTAPASMGYGTKAIIPPGTPTSVASAQVNQNDRIVDGINLIGWSW